ncbi:MAG: D-alanyl-D-alaninecarboxypeptidase/D-alanyl-D-al anine-endopeptidase [Bacteroidota bacterium]|jgi:D-alanyl-D-alanine carboxypeptidase/D-alanyl-D-alanine-endopeptidase (penicillin-binding protein 4)
MEFCPRFLSFAAIGLLTVSAAFAQPTLTPVQASPKDATSDNTAPKGMAVPAAVRNFSWCGPVVPPNWDWALGYLKPVVEQPKVAETPKAAPRILPITTALTDLSMEPALQGASWSFCAIDIKTGEVLAQRDMQRALVPASSMKTLTTSTALALYGTDFVFKTELQYDGQLLEGALNGNIYIKTYGDPLLCSASPDAAMSYESFAAMLARVIRDVGIRSISGYIVADDLIFDPNITEKWQPYSGLISTTTTFTPSETAAFADGEEGVSSPKSKQIISVVSSGGEPALQLAHYFRNALTKSGIQISQPTVTQRALLNSGAASTAPRFTMFTHNSAPLRYIVKRTNERSSNVFAEAILRSLAFRQKGIATTYSGTQVVRDYWTSKGLDLAGSSIQDGSGLSYNNYVSPYTFAKMLILINNDPKIKDSFYESLPLAGVSGTLEKYFQGMSGYGRIHAKTGTLTRILSYTGYAPLADGRTVAFSMIVNNYNGASYAMRQKLTQALSRLVE